MFIDELYIWNPSTTKCRKVPDYVPRKGPYKYGFGYNQDIDDYEIVRISTRVSEETHTVDSVVDLYSLRSNSWRTIPGPIHYIFKEVKSVYVEGSLHWLVLKDKVIAFNSGRETFRGSIAGV
ncbi:hypothetical protein AQUCO_00700020v1 [Aquilegia coerulea]|uniref:F-box associated beta-propeller type 1 domain-containing protein n=1 Tax=Aquilegia coerulea TaxID=218851 RepID=A0A2G5EI44_AQUCA|nr:hypothetical protein AQUCO_00700020v1 [Aquilegia coerulea]